VPPGLLLRELQATQRQPSAAPRTQPRLWQERPEVSHTARALPNVEDRLQRVVETGRRQQGRKTAYTKADSFRAELGLERDHATGAAICACLEQQEQTERAAPIQAKQKMRTLPGELNLMARAGGRGEIAGAARTRLSTAGQVLRRRQQAGVRNDLAARGPP
jgi:hypothetical protein